MMYVSIALFVVTNYLHLGFSFRNIRLRNGFLVAWMMHGFLWLALFLIWSEFLGSTQRLLLASVCFWRPLNILVIQTWPNLVDFVAGKGFVPRFMLLGGPLGRRGSKVVDVLVGSLMYMDWIEFSPFSMGRIWDVTLMAAVVGIVVVVNIVLWLWSAWTGSNGNAHKGVDAMVQESRGRELTTAEHGCYAALALANAICEELSSRGLWRWYFEQLFCNEFKLKAWHSNLAQAIVFGLWHYDGIPSGWSGVVLTTIYGLIMGAMADYAERGLLWPILAHTAADYYIFAILARQQLGASSSGDSSGKKKI